MNTQEKITLNVRPDSVIQAAGEVSKPEKRGQPRLVREIPFVIIHLIPLAALWTGATFFDWALCFSLYVIRMFFVTAGYHRYFSHRTYQTSRIFQFILAFMAETSAQKGILWWSANHRLHHKYSDTPKDPHSMKIYGFWYSHLGWILGPDYKESRWDLVRDLVKFPELRFLDRFHLLPPVVLALTCMALGGWVNGGSPTLMFQAGWSTLFIGFFLSTVLLYHGTFSVNSLMHRFGRPRYKTGDESKNSWWLAIISLGEGWHNNHHYYQSSTRQGFFWWEYDITYYVLRILALFGVVWGIREVPKHVQYSPEHLIAS
ncbi:MAG: acyl-CoA desaturase [Bdellovibrionales bacterium]|nr:acyl-CoA desaturase [Bdellovibrionales bacterium]